jgi:FAD/FMN-containing dehydrogenase
MFLVTGACECVGLVGPLLGGGHGYLQGFYGLVSDNLISARVVLWDGSVIVVSAKQNSGASEVLDIESEVSYSIVSRIKTSLSS